MVSCVHSNEPLKQWDPHEGYRDTIKHHVNRSNETQFSLALSGGGTRAAAFAYGVLEELHHTQVTMEGQSRRLVDEIDALSGVSGGGFTAAYFALYGDRIFEDFEQRFLKRNIKGEIILRLLAPWNWVRLLSPYYSRSDLAIDFYNEQIFDGATFDTLEQGDRPFLRINATDLSSANPFRFSQDQFDFLCSDLSSFPIARAVGASAAVPLIFPPITLQNYAGTCGFEKPTWLEDSLKEARTTSTRRWRYARILDSYLDQDNRPYIHLIDGGISDNLAVRNPLRLASDLSKWERQKEAKENWQRVIGIVVNAQTESELTWRFIDMDPSVGALLASMTNAQIDVISAESMDYLKTLFALWQQQATAAKQHVKVYLIEINFQQAEDETEREYLNSLPTSLNLPDKDVDKLRQAGRRLLRNHPEFQRLLQDLSP
jgi:NTE family protein